MIVLTTYPTFEDALIKASQGKIIFFDIQRDYMFFTSVTSPEFYFMKLYDKTNDMTIACIERAIRKLTELISSDTTLIGYNIKNSIKSVIRAMDGISQNAFSTTQPIDFQVILNLTDREAAESIDRSMVFDSFEDYMTKMSTVYNTLIKKLKSEVLQTKISKVLHNAIVPYACIETKGIRLANTIDREDIDDFEAFVSKSSSSISGDIYKDALIYPALNLFGSVTGRTSSNMHALPKKIRKYFIAREGQKMYSFDYNAGEARVLAGLSGDKKLLYIFNNDLDLHTINASVFFDKSLNSITEQERNEAKTAFFGIINGSTSVIDARTIEKTKKTYSTAFDYLESIRETAIKTLRVENPYGRVRHFSTEELYRFNSIKASNTILQSTLSDIKLEAIYNIYNRFGDIILLEIHDCIYAESGFDLSKEIIEEMCKISIDLGCKLRVNSSVGDSL